MAADRLTLAEMAKRYRTTPKTFRKYVQELGIEHERLGKSLLFDPAVVASYLIVTEKPEKSNVVFMPVPKKKGKQIVTSRKFAEAV